jgi:hypothetical protein
MGGLSPGLSPRIFFLRSPSEGCVGNLQSSRFRWEVVLLFSRPPETTEDILGKEKVPGSNPGVGSKLNKTVSLHLLAHFLPPEMPQGNALLHRFSTPTLMVMRSPRRQVGCVVKP